MLSTFITWLTTSSTAITVLLTAISLISAAFWAVLQYRTQNKDKRFSTYHDLLEKLVNPGSSPDKTLYLDQQIGIVYELRNYPNYFPVSTRILEGLKENEFWQKHSRMIEEIDLTLEYMTSGCFERFYLRHFCSK